MGFVHKSVNPAARIGADLTELRTRAGYTREQAAAYTKIPSFLIRALEDEAWEEIPDAIYAERIVRSYVHALGGNEAYFIHKYREHLAERHEKRTLQDVLPRPSRVRLRDLFVSSRYIALAGFLLFAIALGGYVYVQVHGISSAPPLTIDTPQDGQRLDSPHVEVRGTTLPESSVTVNGVQAVVQSNGVFVLTLDVPRGTTLIYISSRKRHGKAANDVRRVVFERPLPDLEGVQRLIASSTASSTVPGPDTITTSTMATSIKPTSTATSTKKIPVTQTPKSTLSTNVAVTSTSANVSSTSSTR